jgi:hypothetical protein
MAAEHDAGAARPETHAPQGESSSATEHDSRPRGPTVEQRRGGPATVRIRLCPEEGTPREFVPLKVPRGIDVALDEIGPDLVRELSAELELELRPGSYSLALGEHLPLLAEVAAGSRCKARLSVGRAADRPKALLKGARLDFEPAVGLRNVVPILGKLHTLFEDRGLRALLGAISRRSGASPGERLGALGRRAARWQAWLAPELDWLVPSDSLLRKGVAGLREAVERLEHEPERLLMVLLERVTARPMLVDGQWQLDLRFTGAVTYLGRFEFRFEEFLVPRPMLPVPHALLEQLLSAEPLSSAVVQRERLATDRLFEGLSSIVASFLGSFVAELELPRLSLVAALADGGRFELGVSGPPKLAATGSFAGVASHDEIRVKTRDLELRVDDARLGMELDAIVRSSGGPDPSVARRWLDWARELAWPPPHFAIELGVKLEPGSRLAPFELDAGYGHPLMLGGLRLPARVSAAVVGGEVGIGVEPGSGWPRHRGELELRADVDLLAGGKLEEGRGELVPTLARGIVVGHTRWTDRSGLELGVQTELELGLEGSVPMGAFPELDIEQGELRSLLRGRLVLDGHVRTTDLTAPLLEADFSGSTIKLMLDQARLELGRRSLELPAGSELEATVREAVLSTSGLGRGSFDLRWDLGGRSPLLWGEREWVELLVPALRRGRLAVALSPAGGLSITGEKGGLYDARFFNALVNPGAEPQRWLDLLLADEAIEHVLAAVRVFSADAARLLGELRRFALRGRDALRAEGIEQPHGLLPGAAIARVLSRLLVGHPGLSEEIYPLVQRVTDGLGLDVLAVKRLLGAHLPEHDYDWEIDRALRWLAIVLGPTEPVPPRERVEQPPLGEDPRFAEALAGLPSAADLYRVVGATEALPGGFAEELLRVTPYLGLEQLQHLLAEPRQDWPAAARARLQYALELKRRVRLIAENYGGLSFAPQAIAIGFFLGEVARVRAEQVGHSARSEGHASRSADAAVETTRISMPALGDSILGPEDVAVLLQAGLASAWQGRTQQLNRRLLFDLILDQPPSFLHGVLVEMSGASARALAGVLYAMLNHAQDRIREPLDLVALFSERLGIPLPRLEDYMAGGRWAKLSYWEALARAAEQVLAEAEPYLARRARLRVCRLPAAPPWQPSEEVTALADRALGVLAAADELGAQCRFTEEVAGPEDAARRAYQAAFDACAELLRVDVRAFQLDGIKRFWGRNYEALMVLSVVRNVQQDIDDVRRWLSTRSGVELVEPEQALLELVVDTLYYHEADRRRLKADPLVRLLIDPPAGHYDFTIISAMGVITEGARGRELEDAYRRLEEVRGVRTIRANTATARSLDHNAAQVEQAVRGCDTPWGFIGYSQGCANGLQAESRLLGGTPEQQALGERLRCRHLLFSAINGSAHGTCGDWKFLRAMPEADRFLKHYQALFSRQAIRFAVDNLRLLLDSRPMVHTLGGVESLSYEGVRALGRDGQFRDGVPTTSIRGIVEPETLPEALEFLSNVLTRQIQTSAHDTQVEVHEAVGHSLQIDNAYQRVLDRCDMGSLVQRTHHWSPIVREVEFITTERDRRQAVYDTPKDRHVVPWIEVNARFGVIRRKEEP